VTVVPSVALTEDGTVKHDTGTVTVPLLNAVGGAATAAENELPSVAVENSIAYTVLPAVVTSQPFPSAPTAFSRRCGLASRSVSTGAGPCHVVPPSAL
jgi:hypothetical protein